MFTPKKMAKKGYSSYNSKGRGGGLSRFIVSILGGMIGAALVLGIYVKFNDITPSQLTTTQQGTSNSSKKTTQTVSVDVTNDVTKAVAKVQDAVVSVQNYKAESNNSNYGSLSDLFGRNNNTDAEPQLAGEGSGVIYRKDGDQAYVVTNNHVVEGASKLEVILTDGTKVSGKLIETDVTSDLAVIEISSENVTTVASFGDSDALKVGEPAIAIGSPLGSQYANSVTQGIISAKDRPIVNKTDSGQSTNINAIQTDAAINPGNSGGPLINIAGQVIGINSIKFAQTQENGISVEGMGFAIPSNDVSKIVEQLEQGKKVVRPMLGVTMLPLAQVSQESIKTTLKIPDDIKEGIVLTKVESDYPAANAGLQAFDVIIEVDGKAISSDGELQSALYSKNIGDKMEVTYYRGSDKKTTTVTLDKDDSSLNN